MARRKIEITGWEVVIYRGATIYHDEIVRVGELSKGGS
jgi:hypothetical protein